MLFCMANVLMSFTIDIAEAFVEINTFLSIQGISIFEAKTN